MAHQLDTEASAPGLGVETGPLPGLARGPRAGGLSARPLFHRDALGWVRSFVLLLAGAAIASTIWLSRAEPPAAPAGVQRTWSTSEVAAYLGLGDASTFSSGITCQLYIQRDRPYRWIVSLCHR